MVQRPPKSGPSRHSNPAFCNVLMIFCVALCDRPNSFQCFRGARIFLHYFMPTPDISRLDSHRQVGPKRLRNLWPRTQLSLNVRECSDCEWRPFVHQHAPRTGRRARQPADAPITHLRRPVVALHDRRRRNFARRQKPDLWQFKD